MTAFGIEYYLKKATELKAFTLLLAMTLLISGHSFGQETIKMRKVSCAGGVIFHPLSPDKIAIVMGKSGSWSFPKGHVENDETYFETAIREIYEETGLIDLVFERELSAYERKTLKNRGAEDYLEVKTIHMFLFRTKSTDLCPIDPANPAAKWANAQECLKLLKYQGDKEFLMQNVLPLMGNKL